MNRYRLEHVRLLFRVKISNKNKNCQGEDTNQRYCQRPRAISRKRKREQENEENMWSIERRNTEQEIVFIQRRRKQRRKRSKTFGHHEQGGRSWHPFGECKDGHKICQVRICYFRDKFVIFARNCKFANLFQYNMQYILPSNIALLAHETLVLPKQVLFLPKVFQTVRKS